MMSKLRWRAWCRCGWQGKVRRNNLRALEDCHAHWCARVVEGVTYRVQSFDKGIRRDDE